MQVRDLGLLRSLRSLREIRGVVDDEVGGREYTVFTCRWWRFLSSEKTLEILGHARGRRKESSLGRNIEKKTN